jgi:hypothetical protein
MRNYGFLIHVQVEAMVLWMECAGIFTFSFITRASTSKHKKLHFPPRHEAIKEHELEKQNPNIERIQ